VANQALPLGFGAFEASKEMYLGRRERSFTLVECFFANTIAVYQSERGGRRAVTFNLEA